MKLHENNKYLFIHFCIRIAATNLGLPGVNESLIIADIFRYLKRDGRTLDLLFAFFYTISFIKH